MGISPPDPKDTLSSIITLTSKFKSVGNPRPEAVHRIMSDLQINIKRLKSARFGKTHKGRFFVKRLEMSLNDMQKAVEGNKPFLHHIGMMKAISVWKRRELTKLGAEKPIESYPLTAEILAEVYSKGEHSFLCEIIGINPENRSEQFLLATSPLLFSLRDMHKWIKEYAINHDARQARLKKRGLVDPPFWPKPNPAKSLKRTARGRVVGRCVSCETTKHMKATANPEIWQCGSCGWEWKSGLE